MHWVTQLGMSKLGVLLICWLYQKLPGALAFPVSSSSTSDSTESKLWLPQFHYILGSVVVVAMVSAFLGCLCCRRERRAKGFQDTKGNKEQEFKDGSIVGSETIIERGLELEVSRSTNSTNQFQFEPLTVERFVPETRGILNKPSKPPSPSLISDNSLDKDENNLSPCQEWFSPSLHVPRERLKYLREIGRGWFGKVVEGTQDLDPGGTSPKNNGVVVRILTEEASTSERAWFLGEALPYLKLHHQNLLKLLGVCLETDPYLLLFESCPGGDLKTFLKSNRHSNETLIQTNIPIKMAIDISIALDHMHRHGFAHTDLSARNCLVATDLSAKLGDYGIGVEKYPGDYYVVGDRALPIRWSAPESLVCTDTTIETRTITPQANLWSFAILLWEIGSWGERPYDDLGDDQVIEMILSCRFYDHLPFRNLKESPDNLLEAIKSCLKLEPNDRAGLKQIIEILKEKNCDFDLRWETLKPNTKEPMRSLSLKELRQSTDSDLWQADDKAFSTPQASFKLGPGELIRNAPLARTDVNLESGSETEEESWRGRVERGAYTEKVRQKSKSVADLMVLVHIDSDSEAEWSIGPQVNEKPRKKLASGSVGDLRSTARADEFDKALKKLRNPSSVKILKESNEKSLESAESISKEENKNIVECTSTPKNNLTSAPNNFVDVELWKNALEFELERKVSGFDLESIDFGKLIGDKCESRSASDLLETSISAPNTPQSRGEDLSVDNEDFSNSEEVETERRRLPDGDEEEDRKHLSTPDDERSSDSGFRDKESCEEEENPIPCSLSHSALNSYGALFNTPLSASTEEEQLKVLLELDNILDAEDCKSLDGQDISLSPSKINLNILEEDSIILALKSQLDSPINDTDLKLIDEKIFDKLDIKINEKNIDSPEKQIEEASNLEPTENTVHKLDIKDNKDINFVEKVNEEILDFKLISTQAVEESIAKDEKEIFPDNKQTAKPDLELIEKNVDELIAEVERNLNSIEKKFEEPLAKLDSLDKSNIESSMESQDPENDNDDEDSSTMSLRSDNSYVSFNLDEEFVAAIRNELQEKLPRAQMSIVESQELRDDEVSAVNLSENEKKSWEYEDDTNERESSNIDIAIRYNLYGTPLSPILEERESNATSESLGDASIASKLSGFSEDVLVVDTRTNRVLLVEGSFDRQDDDRDTSHGDMTDDESADCDSNNFGNNLLGIQDKITGVPMPSPEEESKWQAQFPIQLQDDLMSTSFSTEHDWDSQDEDEKAGEDATEEDDDDSSSSGEFVWKRYDDIPENESKNADTEGKIEEEAEYEDEDEEEFTPSAWDATLAPHRSALRSPEKTLKTGLLPGGTGSEKNVWFKKQRYHCVYEYPKETLVPECQGQATTTWEPTSYADWEEMLEEPKVDHYPIDYESNHDDEEFFVSSGNRPFQFQVGDGKYVSQFFPGAAESSQENESHGNLKINTVDDNQSQQQQQTQLGKLRHTRDRLKLNLPIKNTSDTSSTVIITEIETDQNEQASRINDESDTKTEKTETSTESSISKDDQSIISVIRSPMESSFENSSHEDIKSSSNAESDGEISELEISFSCKENAPVKSSRRPLVISDKNNVTSKDNLPDQSHDVIERVDDTLTNVQKVSETIKEQEQKLLVMEKKQDEVLSKDECSLKPSENDHVINTSKTDVE